MPSITEIVKNNIQITLVNPQVPDNIGLAARVMKNTGFHNLALIAPAATQKSFEVAKRARDLLQNAKTFDTLGAAIRDSVFVFGATRRPREFRFAYSFEGIKPFILAQARKQKISILFGREDFGLSGQDLKCCDSIFYLPAKPEFSSYNLASSVGIVCYSLLVLSESLSFTQSLELAKKKDIEGFFLYLKTHALTNVEAKRLPSIIESLKRIVLRTHLTKNEVSLLKGLLMRRKRSISKEINHTE